MITFGIAAALAVIVAALGGYAIGRKIGFAECEETVSELRSAYVAALPPLVSQAHGRTMDAAGMAPDRIRWTPHRLLQRRTVHRCHDDRCRKDFSHRCHNLDCRR